MEGSPAEAALPVVISKREQLEVEDVSSKRRASTPLCCKVLGCTSDLTSAPKTHQRFRLCNAHIKAPAIVVDGVPSRFCQQCSRFQPLDQFHETNRTCRMMLAKNRERQRSAAASGGGAGGSASGRAASPVSEPRPRHRRQGRQLLPSFEQHSVGDSGGGGCAGRGDDGSPVVNGGEGCLPSTASPPPQARSSAALVALAVAPAPRCAAAAAPDAAAGEIGCSLPGNPLAGLATTTAGVAACSAPTAPSLKPDPTGCMAKLGVAAAPEAYTATDMEPFSGAALTAAGECAKKAAADTVVPPRIGVEGTAAAAIGGGCCPQRPAHHGLSLASTHATMGIMLLEQPRAAIVTATTAAQAAASPFARCSAPPAMLSHHEGPDRPLSPVAFAAPPPAAAPLSPLAEVSGIWSGDTRHARSQPQKLLQNELGHLYRTRGPRDRLLRQLSVEARRAQSCEPLDTELRLTATFGRALGVAGAASADGAALFARASAPPLGSQPSPGAAPGAGVLQGTRSTGLAFGAGACALERISSGSFKRRRSGDGDEASNVGRADVADAGMATDGSHPEASGERKGSGPDDTSAALTETLSAAETSQLPPPPVSSQPAQPLTEPAGAAAEAGAAASGDGGSVTTAMAALVQQQGLLLEQQRLQVQQLQELQRQNELQLRHLLRMRPLAETTTAKSASPSASGRRRHKRTPSGGSANGGSSGSGGSSGGEPPGAAAGGKSHGPGVGCQMRGLPVVHGLPSLTTTPVVALVGHKGFGALTPRMEAAHRPGALCALAGGPAAGVTAPGRACGAAGGGGGGAGAAAAAEPGGEDELLAAIAAAAMGAAAVGEEGESLAALAVRWRCEEGPDGADGPDLMDVDEPRETAAPPLPPPPSALLQELYSSLPAPPPSCSLGLAAAVAGLSFGLAAAPAAPAGAAAWFRSAQSEPAWGSHAHAGQRAYYHVDRAQGCPPIPTDLQQGAMAQPALEAPTALPSLPCHALSACRLFSPLRPSDPMGLPPTYSRLAGGPTPTAPFRTAAAKVGSRHVSAAAAAAAAAIAQPAPPQLSSALPPPLAATVGYEVAAQSGRQVRGGATAPVAGPPETSAVRAASAADGSGSGERKAVGEETEELLEQLMSDIFGGAAGAAAAAAAPATQEPPPAGQEHWAPPLLAAPADVSSGGCSAAVQPLLTSGPTGRPLGVGAAHAAAVAAESSGRSGGGCGDHRPGCFRRDPASVGGSPLRGAVSEPCSQGRGAFLGAQQALGVSAGVAGPVAAGSGTVGPGASGPGLSADGADSSAAGEALFRAGSGATGPGVTATLRHQQAALWGELCWVDEQQRLLRAQMAETHRCALALAAHREAQERRRPQAGPQQQEQPQGPAARRACAGDEREACAQ